MKHIKYLGGDYFVVMKELTSHYVVIDASGSIFKIKKIDAIDINDTDRKTSKYVSQISCCFNCIRRLHVQYA